MPIGQDRGRPPSKRAKQEITRRIFIPRVTSIPFVKARGRAAERDVPLAGATRWLDGGVALAGGVRLMPDGTRIIPDGTKIPIGDIATLRDGTVLLNPVEGQHRILQWDAVTVSNQFLKCCPAIAAQVGEVGDVVQPNAWKEGNITNEYPSNKTRQFLSALYDTTANDADDIAGDVASDIQWPHWITRGMITEMDEFATNDNADWQVEWAMAKGLMPGELEPGQELSFIRLVLLRRLQLACIVGNTSYANFIARTLAMRMMRAKILINKHIIVGQVDPETLNKLLQRCGPAWQWTLAENGDIAPMMQKYFQNNCVVCSSPYNSHEVEQLVQKYYNTYTTDTGQATRLHDGSMWIFAMHSSFDCTVFNDGSCTIPTLPGIRLQAVLVPELREETLHQWGGTASNQTAQINAALSVAPITSTETHYVHVDHTQAELLGLQINSIRVYSYPKELLTEGERPGLSDEYLVAKLDNNIVELYMDRGSKVVTYNVALFHDQGITIVNRKPTCLPEREVVYSAGGLGRTTCGWQTGVASVFCRDQDSRLVLENGRGLLQLLPDRDVGLNPLLLHESCAQNAFSLAGTIRKMETFRHYTHDLMAVCNVARRDFWASIDLYHVFSKVVHRDSKKVGCFYVASEVHEHAVLLTNGTFINELGDTVDGGGLVVYDTRDKYETTQQHRLLTCRPAANPMSNVSYADDPINYERGPWSVVCSDIATTRKKRKAIIKNALVALWQEQADVPYFIVCIPKNPAELPVPKSGVVDKFSVEVDSELVKASFTFSIVIKQGRQWKKKGNFYRVAVFMQLHDVDVRSIKDSPEAGDILSVGDDQYMHAKLEQMLRRYGVRPTEKTPEFIHLLLHKCLPRLESVIHRTAPTVLTIHYSNDWTLNFCYRVVEDNRYAIAKKTKELVEVFMGAEAGKFLILPAANTIENGLLRNVNCNVEYAKAHSNLLLQEYITCVLQVSDWAPRGDAEQFTVSLLKQRIMKGSSMSFKSGPRDSVVHGARDLVLLTQAFGDTSLGPK